MGVIESVRSASPAGWVVTVGGRELILADEHQALIRVTAIGAYQEMEEREGSVPTGEPGAAPSWAVAALGWCRYRTFHAFSGRVFL
jgi:hypothetical protein